MCGEVLQSLILSVFPCLTLNVVPPTQLDILISGVLLNNIHQLWNSSVCVSVYISYALPFSFEMNGRVEHVSLGHIADSFA